MTKGFDFILLSATLLLVIIGLILLHAINFNDPELVQGFNPSTQVVAAGLGLTALLAAARSDYRLWLRLAPAWYFVSMVLLAILPLVGDRVFGATLAIDLGPVEFQPTEVAKIGLIFMIARLYARHAQELNRLRWFAGSLLLLGVMVGLTLQLPDAGSVAVMAAIWLMITLMSKVPKLYVALLLGGLLIISPLAYQQLEPYQQDRVQTFVNPSAADPQGAGYNVNQAVIAVGAGQLLGRGLGGGSQGQLNFLPSQHTDFAFAVLAEKLGLLGAGLVIGLFALLLGRSIRIVYRCQDWFGVLLGSGIVAMIFVHVVVTIGMNLGVVPVTGLPLPFISYGGTNLIVMLFAIGLLESIATHTQELQFKE